MSSSKKRKGQQQNSQALVVYRPPKAAPSRAQPRQTQTMVRKQPSTSGWSAPDVGQYLGGGIGSLLAPGIGTAAGGLLGRGLGVLFKHVTGYGGYKVSSNTLLNDLGETQMTFGETGARIKRREFIGLISGSVAFTNNIYSINPGLSLTFPWLSQIANAFQQWRPHGMIFEYVATASQLVNSTNTAQGNVVLATDYDADDATFINLPQAMSATYANSGPPTVNITHAIECAYSRTPVNWLYTRAGALPTNADLVTRDLGTFQLITQGMAAANNIGQLWVAYDIEFTKPISDAQVGANLLTDHWILTAAGSGATSFGTSRSLATGSNLGSTCSATVFHFPPELETGAFLFLWTSNGASTNPCLPPTFTGTNCTAQTFWDNDTAALAASGNNTQAILLSCTIWQITSAAAIVTASGGTPLNTLTFGDLWVTQINGNISGFVKQIVEERRFRTEIDRREREAYIDYKKSLTRSKSLNDVYCPT